MSDANWDRARRLTTLVDELEKAINKGRIKLNPNQKKEFERLHGQYIMDSFEPAAKHGEFSESFLKVMQQYLTFVEGVMKAHDPNWLNDLFND